MVKQMTCIECPKGCALAVKIEGGKVAGVTGNKCPKGIGYAIAEIENPVRILTSTILAEGLGVKMVPVRTDKPIPKTKLSQAMKAIHSLKIDAPVKAGETIVPNFLGLEVNLISTRECR